MENVKREPVVDRINKLPTEVLGLIFSFLSFKEAVAKGLVCPRWKNLRTLTPNLDFDCSNSVIEKVFNTRFPYNRETVLSEERRKFVKWVDGVIASRQNSKLKEFRVFSDLNSDHTETINKWVAYAFNNNVESLELSFIDCTLIRTNRNHHLCYDFPFNNKSYYKNLKQLILHSVNVTGEALELLVSDSSVVELPHTKHVTIEREREIRETINVKHLNLKEVEFVGYSGVITQLELLMHFVDNAIALQNIIVDPCTFKLNMQRPWHLIPLHELDEEMFARARAEDQLKHIVPSKIALKIL